MKNLFVIISIVRLLPHYLIYLLHPNKKIIEADVCSWLIRGDEGVTNFSRGMFTLLTLKPEFRNLFYKRIGNYSFFVRWLCPRMDSLYIATKNIGPGLFIQHGFATIIAANSIGENCWINQQVTIGYSNSTDCPTLLDNVSIGAGAKIIGKVTLGNNVKVGANAVVVKNVPDNCTVIGVPAYIIKKNGTKVHEIL